ncbi:ensconsin isoform X2 [Oncorhynchus tshawytscha]|uniref:Ensconsin n=1 Tax=Oncorhynchus tshawytscha TaxID=74940 RepID=A0AAZ3R1A1_ONCTS|nr:ensconsin isoform X2 [Oncorhynchus tshawytscha]
MNGDQRCDGNRSVCCPPPVRQGTGFPRSTVSRLIPQSTSGMADQDSSNASPETQVSDSQTKAEERRWSGQTQSSTPTVTLSPTPSNNAANKPEPLVLKIDERQRLARERREEREKQTAAREAVWQEREERARHYYDKHLEERKRKMEEQRRKEDRRRSAVEEKRRQNLEEEKARHEAVMRRTVERSQRAKHTPNRWSWGGALPGNTPTTPGGFVESSFLYPLDLAGLEHHLQGAFSVYRRYGLSHQYADRRSVSTMNLSKHAADPVITKRLSYSSATLLHSPDRGMRCMPLTPWENTVVNRLLQPTHSYLARSRSAMSLSGDTGAMPVCPRSVSCHPMGSMSFKSIQSQPLTVCRSQEPRLPRDMTNRRRTTGNAPDKHKDFVRKSWSNLSLPLTTLPLTTPTAKRFRSPGKQQTRVTTPSPVRPPQKLSLPPSRPPQKLSPRPSTPKQLRSPSGEDLGNLRPSRTVPESLSLIGLQAGGPEGDQGAVTPSQPRPQSLGHPKACPSTDTKDTLSAVSESVGSSPAHKSTAGTTDPEEATRVLAEKRRQAREQRERGEERRGIQEEAERCSKAEERQRREEEEERRREEEEEERAQQEREEAERQQKQREEEECRQREDADRLRKEREKHFQKEEAERLERKKRLEEIMKRTRRSDQVEKKATLQKNIDESASNCDSPDPSVSLSGAEHSDRNGASNPNTDPSTALLPPADERENGLFEEVIVLPADSRLPPGEEQHVPATAFQENGIVKPLREGVDDPPTQHTADV